MGKEFSHAYHPGPRAALTKTSVRNVQASAICNRRPALKKHRTWRNRTMYVPPVRYTSLRLGCRAPSDSRTAWKPQRTLPVCLTKRSDLCLTHLSRTMCRTDGERGISPLPMAYDTLWYGMNFHLREHPSDTSGLLFIGNSR